MCGVIRGLGFLGLFQLILYNRRDTGAFLLRWRPSALVLFRRWFSLTVYFCHCFFSLLSRYLRNLGTSPVLEGATSFLLPLRFLHFTLLYHLTIYTIFGLSCRHSLWRPAATLRYHLASNSIFGLGSRLSPWRPAATLRYHLAISHIVGIGGRLSLRRPPATLRRSLVFGRIYGLVRWPGLWRPAPTLLLRLLHLTLFLRLDSLT
mmetsp:Transcript_23644/g.51422  ORF Transcript_23644/g.51422 Transcript_23644/m.51422 type:complete len:205 (-) Transcript_23644:133-747(-)